MYLARGDWYFMVCALVMGVFMAVPYIYAAQQDNYRVAEVWKSRRVHGAYLTDLLCILVFGGAWAGCWFISSRIFWGFLISLFLFFYKINSVIHICHVLTLMSVFEIHYRILVTCLFT